MSVSINMRNGDSHLATGIELHLDDETIDAYSVNFENNKKKIQVNKKAIKKKYTLHYYNLRRL